MSRHLVLVCLFLLFLFCAAKAQWMQKVGYEELSAPVGEVNSMVVSADGLSVYLISVSNSSTKALYSLQAIDARSGMTLWSKGLNALSSDSVIDARISSDGRNVVVQTNHERYSANSDLIAYSIPNLNKVDSVQVLAPYFYQYFYLSSPFDYSITTGRFSYSSAKYGSSDFKFNHYVWTEGSLRQYSSHDSSQNILLRDRPNSYYTTFGKSSSKIYSLTQYFSSNSGSIPSYYSIDAYRSDGSRQLLDSVMNAPYYMSGDSSFQFQLRNDEKVFGYGTSDEYYFFNTEDGLRTQIINGSKVLAATFSSNGKYLHLLMKSNSCVTFHTGLIQTCGAKALPFGLAGKARVAPILSGDSLVVRSNDGSLRRVSLVQDTLSQRVSTSQSDTLQYVDTTVTFHARVEDAMSSRCLWKFDDGSIDSGLTVRHDFHTPGMQLVRLVVFNSKGDSIGVAVASVRIIPKTIVAFDSDTLYGLPPLTVHFYDKSLGDIQTRNWQFDYLDSSLETNPIYVFKESQAYNVSLSIFDGIKQYTLLKVMYINVAEYPTSAIQGELKFLETGGRSNGDYYSGESVTSSIKQFCRTPSGALYTRLQTSYNRWTYSGSNYNTNGSSDAYSVRVHNDCSLATRIYIAGYSAPIQVNHTFAGTLAPYRDSTLVFTARVSHMGGAENSYTGYIKADSVIRDSIPYCRGYFKMRPLRNNRNSYVYPFQDSTIVVLVKNSNQVITQSVIKANALPLVQSENGKRTVQFVSGPITDSLKNRRISIIEIDAFGKNVHTTRYTPPTCEIFKDNTLISGENVLAVGEEVLDTVRVMYGSHRTNALIEQVTMDGQVLQRTIVPQWRYFDRIDRLSDSVFAIGGGPVQLYPGFIVYHIRRGVIADLRISQPGATIEDYSFLNDSNDIVFGGSIGYNAALYKSSFNMMNLARGYFVPAVIDQDDSMSTENASILAYPNPGSGEITLRFASSISGPISGKVFDSIGMQLQSFDSALDANYHSLRLTLKSRASGIYFIELRGTTWTQTIPVSVVNE